MLYYFWSLKGYFQAGDGPGNIIINDTYETYFAEISPLVSPPHSLNQINVWGLCQLFIF